MNLAFRCATVSHCEALGEADDQGAQECLQALNLKARIGLRISSSSPPPVFFFAKGQSVTSLVVSIHEVQTFSKMSPDRGDAISRPLLKSLPTHKSKCFGSETSHTWSCYRPRRTGNHTAVRQAILEPGAFRDLQVLVPALGLETTQWLAQGPGLSGPAADLAPSGRYRTS